MKEFKRNLACRHVFPRNSKRGNEWNDWINKNSQEESLWQSSKNWTQILWPELQTNLYTCSSLHDVCSQQTSVVTGRLNVERDWCGWQWEKTPQNDLIPWKLFSYYWPFVRGIHWSPADSFHKGQSFWILMFAFQIKLLNVISDPMTLIKRHCDETIMHISMFFVVVRHRLSLNITISIISMALWQSNNCHQWYKSNQNWWHNKCNAKGTKPFVYLIEYNVWTACGRLNVIVIKYVLRIWFE